MKKYSWVLVALLFTACGGGGDSAQKTEPAADTKAAQQAAPETEAPAVAMAGPVAKAQRTVACGCSIEGVGACGNYIQINDQFVEIANWEEMGLGAMEWCGQQGVHADSEGEIKDGKFFAATLAVHAH